MLTKVKDCDLLMVYFSKKKRHVKRKKQLAQIIKTRSTAYIDKCTVHTYTVYMYIAL